MWNTEQKSFRPLQLLFAHLHPSGSISRAAMQKFAADAAAGPLNLDAP